MTMPVDRDWLGEGGFALVQWGHAEELNFFSSNDAESQSKDTLDKWIHVAWTARRLRWT